MSRLGSLSFGSSYGLSTGTGSARSSGGASGDALDSFLSNKNGPVAPNTARRLGSLSSVALNDATQSVTARRLSSLSGAPIAPSAKPLSQSSMSAAPFAPLPRQLSKENRPDMKEPSAMPAAGPFSIQGMPGPASNLSSGQSTGRRAGHGRRATPSEDVTAQKPLSDNEEKLKDAREAKENVLNQSNRGSSSAIRPAAAPQPQPQAQGRPSLISSSATSSISSKSRGHLSGDSDGESGSDRENSSTSPSADSSTSSFSGKRNDASSAFDSKPSNSLSFVPTPLSSKAPIGNAAPAGGVASAGSARPAALIRCPDCNRSFKRASFTVHQRACKKVFKEKREQFDSRKTRMAGELEAYADKVTDGSAGPEEASGEVVEEEESFEEGEMRPEPPSKREPATARPGTSGGSWRSQSSELRKAMKNAKRQQLSTASNGIDFGKMMVAPPKPVIRK